MIETKIIDWFRKVFPTPASRNFNTQIGCHFEEVSEMLSALAGDDAASAERIETLREQIGAFADAVKGGQVRLSVKDPVELLDSICDQVVTGVGTGYLAGLDVPPAVAEVAASNESKFDENGAPIFDDNLKVMKGPNYFKPNLTPFVAQARFTKETVA